MIDPVILNNLIDALTKAEKRRDKALRNMYVHYTKINRRAEQIERINERDESKAEVVSLIKQIRQEKDRLYRGVDHLITYYKSSAKKRGYDWELSDHEACELFLGDCHYCGIERSSFLTLRTGIKVIYNGIDRVDSNFGYIKNNCVACCHLCNTRKNRLPFDDFVNRWESLPLGQKKIELKLKIPSDLIDFIEHKSNGDIAQWIKEQALYLGYK